MKNAPNSTPSLSKNEPLPGSFYLVFQLLLLPGLLTAINALLPRPLSSGELNFTFYLLNFLAVLWIFQDFLGRSAAVLRRRFFPVLQAVILGTVFYFACAWGLELFFARFAPGFHNANDASIAAMGRESRYLMTIGTVLLVPLAEECFYRGLVFRNIYSTSPVLAYIVSILVFAAIHILGFVSSYTPVHLLLAFLQYVPAGVCLAWSYQKAGTIFAPVAVHAIVNAVGIYRLR